MSEMAIVQGSDSRLSTLKSSAYYKKLFATEVDTPFLLIDKSVENNESCLFTQNLSSYPDASYQVVGSAMFLASRGSDLEPV